MTADDQGTDRAATTGALSGIVVVDVSRVLAGPLCTQMLADHGATVVKVEPPAGDETRTWGPPFVGADSSAYFQNLNRNKVNICLDLTTLDGIDVLRRLLDRADVLVENYKAGTLDRWGLGDEVLAEAYPALVHCRITGFGVDGPMGAVPGYDAIAQAYSGLMSINGEAHGDPLRIGVPVVDMVTGIYAFSGVLLALHERHRSGLGQLVDCTLLDSAVSLLHPHSASYLADGREPVRTGSAHPTIAPYETFTAAGGEQIFVAAGNDRQFRELAEQLGCPGLADDPRFAHNGDRVAHRPDLRELIAEQVARCDAGELAGRLSAGGVPAARVNTVGQALRDAQVTHRRMTVQDGGYRGIGAPIKLGRTPGSAPRAPRRKGEDTRAVLADLGYGPGRIDELVEAAVAIAPDREPR
ncbi:CaiB/BaiF CoA transferase family protein [Mycolicibacterium sp.]|uniref:CaiB/BaiF CoA transferase family protein n=1 Tax=Mycolicibacterium sp. TaxID=2320850 RepID=UPI003D0FD7E3